MKQVKEYEKKLATLFKERVYGKPDVMIGAFLDSYSDILLSLFPDYAEWIKNRDPSDKDKIKRLKRILREEPFYLAGVIRKAGITKKKEIEWILEMLCCGSNGGMLWFFDKSESLRHIYSEKWKRIFEKGK